MSRIVSATSAPNAQAGSGRDRWNSGSMTVELAFAVPVMLMFLGAIVQFGALFFLQSMMTDAARISVRGLALGELTAVEAEQAALDRLTGWQINFTVEAFEPDPGNPEDRDVSLAISAPMAEATLVDILSIFGVEDLGTVVTMRQES